MRLGIDDGAFIPWGPIGLNPGQLSKSSYQSRFERQIAIKKDNSKESFKDFPKQKKAKHILWIYSLVLGSKILNYHCTLPFTPYHFPYHFDWDQAPCRVITRAARKPRKCLQHTHLEDLQMPQPQFQGNCYRLAASPMIGCG